MKKITSEIKKACMLNMALLVTGFLSAQVVRPYTNIYSDNIKGGHTIIGNTITAIYSSGSGSTGTVNTVQMNDFSTSGSGSYTFGRTSAYGNDNSNIQFVDVDGILPATTFIASGANWNYSNADVQPANWPIVTTLAGGPGASPLGYGPTGTVGTPLTDRRTYYFTKTINLNPASYSDLTFDLTLDDGAIVYVNGIEVKRINMPTGTITFTTDASSAIEPEESSNFTIASGSPFINGNNTIQVEVHTSANNEPGTDDLFFDLQLTGTSINQTFNSSSANLILPSGSNTIKFARLYWGGRIESGTGEANNINFRTAKIKFDFENYQTVIAASGDIDKSLINSSTSDSAYQSFCDVTAYVNARKGGTYTIANVAASTGSVNGGGFYAGWALVIVYENPSLSYSSLRVYDGFLQVYDDGTATSQSITLNGLNPPANFSASSDAYMSTVSWEGDANLAASSSNPNGDFVKVNGITASNAVNPSTNFWNGTISKNGLHLTGNKNPDYKNQMGIDIDELEVGTGFGITPATTNVAIQFGTEADQYFPSVFAFTMKTKPPIVQLDKIVQDTASGNSTWQIPNGLINPNEVLTYTIVGKNMGSGNALNCVIIDSIPGTLTYRPGSLIVNAPTPGVTAGCKTDVMGDDAAFKSTFEEKEYVKFFIGTGATASGGGTLAPNDSFNVQFQCVAPSNTKNLGLVSNTARITGTEQDGVTAFVDDGTAIIGAESGPVAINLIEFSAQRQNNNILLQWVTASEIQNDHFDIERSEDGILFYKVGTVTGSGNSSTTKKYQFTDAVNSTGKMFYYRLKIVDKNSYKVYSKIVAVKLDGPFSIKNLSVYPNPFVDNIKLQINSNKIAHVLIKILNAGGSEQANFNVNVQQGQNIIVLTALQNLAAGTYTIQLISGNDILTQKIIKQ